jgi:[acyl-carrier-protein] S-malonyltransferase
LHTVEGQGAVAHAVDAAGCGRLAHVLHGASLHAPTVRLFANALPRVLTAPEAAEALSAQIAQTVQLDACLQALGARRVDCVLEIGAGSALSAMWNRRHPETPARSVDEFRNRDAIVKWVLRQG